MSQSDVFAALAAKLRHVDPSPQPAPNRVFENSAEAVNLGDCPAMALMLAFGQENSVVATAADGAYDSYSIAIYVFVGMRETGIEELVQRCQPWPKAIAKVLMADLHLGLPGYVEFIGYGEDPRLFTYSVGPIKWAGDDYFGLKINLPIQERFYAPVG